MDTEEAGASGVMVLSLWVEQGQLLRVRVTSTTDPPSGRSSTNYASSPAEVLLLVSAWLDEFASAAPR